MLRKILNFFKRKKNTAVDNQEVEIPYEAKSIRAATKKKVPKKKYRRVTRYTNTPLNPINRHSAYGFAYRQSMKLERKPRGPRPPTLPVFFQHYK